MPTSTMNPEDLMRMIDVIHREKDIPKEVIFRALEEVKAWIPADGYYDQGPGPRISQANQETMYPLSECMSCGCCLEACPQYLKIEVERHAGERLDALMAEGGIQVCGNAQNCVAVCPKKIPLTTSIGQAGRDTTLHALHKIFG